MSNRIAVAALITALSVSPVAAEWVAKASTTKGGQIVLLRSVGGCEKGMLRMYIAESTGRLIAGCWTATDLHVIVVFDDGIRMAYDYTGWDINRKPKQEAGGSNF
jgi:hypothetical protein